VFDAYGAQGAGLELAAGIIPEACISLGCTGHKRE